MRRAFSLGFFLLLNLIATVAHADEPAEEAERLFNEARELVSQGKAQEACPRFERSQKLDPAVGTQFNLADCYEKLGKFASAYRLFQELHETLMRVGDKRAAKAEERTTALEGRVPKITLEIPWAGSAPGLVVQLDNAIVEPSRFGVPISLDPGPHRIIVRADHKEPFSKDVVAQVATPQTLTVPELQNEAARAVFVERPSSSGRRTVAWVVGGMGAAALGTGIVLGAIAKGNYDDGLQGCRQEGNTARCPPGVGDAGKVDASRNLATVGTVVGAVGVVAIVAGAVLWITAPRSKMSEATAWKRMNVALNVVASGEAGIQAKGTF